MRSAAILLLIHVPSGCAIGAQRKQRPVHSIHATQRISSTYPKPANHGAGFPFTSPSRDLALASPPSPPQTAARCAVSSPSRRVARSLLAAAVGHRAFVQVGADQRHVTVLQPPVHLLAGETSLGLLAPEQPAGAMDGRVERGARLRALDALDDHRIVAHGTADKATLTRERRRRALAHHPYIAPLVGLAPAIVM